jgi:hypothetical protein
MMIQLTDQQANALRVNLRHLMQVDATTDAEDEVLESVLQEIFDAGDKTTYECLACNKWIEGNHGDEDYHLAAQIGATATNDGLRCECGQMMQHRTWRRCPICLEHHADGGDQCDCAANSLPSAWEKLARANGWNIADNDPDPTSTISVTPNRPMPLPCGIGSGLDAWRLGGRSA